MARRLNENSILSALMDDSNSDGDTDVLFLAGSEGDSDHLSVQSVSDSEEEVEDISSGESSSSQAFYIGKDGKTKWQKEPLRTNVRTRQENIITHLPGVKSQYKDKITSLECFEVFISNEILESVVKHTNAKICVSRPQLPDGESLNTLYNETTKYEIKAVFGLLFLAGLYRSGRQNFNDLWASDGTGIEIFRCTMSKNRFSFLLNNMRFDDATTREDRIKTDRLAPIRNIFDIFVQLCQNAYTPSEYLTLDEELVAFRGRCGFRQYVPSNPAKYGIKIYALVDAKTFYTVHLEIYCGKQPDNSPYALSNKPFDLVDRMVNCISGSSRNVTMDNFFTSHEAAENLLQKHKLTVVGTLRANKACIPPCFKQPREEYSSRFGFQKDVTLASYIPKPRKYVYVMSSLHHDKEIDHETGIKQKPSMITFYNQTKSGVDVVDKLARTYDVSHNTKRWPLTLFFSMLNHAGINAMILHMLNNGIEAGKTKKFIRDLGMALIEEHLKNRKDNLRIPKDFRKRIHVLLGETSVEPPKKMPRRIMRCSECDRRKDRKTKYGCERCEVPICLEHAYFFCKNCADLNQLGSQED